MTSFIRLRVGRLRCAAFGLLCLIGLCLTGPIKPCAADERPNVLLICVDDLRPELHCYGVDYIYSPNIDRLAASGRAFTRHFVQAPTCGASRCALLTGQYGGTDNNALFQRAEAIESGRPIDPSMPAWFRSNGYTTVSVGKVSHHPGGRGGPDWNDDTKLEMPNSWDRAIMPTGDWQHPRGWMHGLANGEIRGKSSDMDVFQSVAGPDTIYPDGLSTESGLKELKALTADSSKPFFLAIGILRPHLPFGAPAKYMEYYANAKLPPTAHPEKPAGKTTWHRSGEFMGYNRWNRDPNSDAEFAMEVRKHYAACVSFADAQVGRILEQLEQSGAADNTIVVLWGDHGWHLGEHAIWGKHALFEESLHSPLIVKYPNIKKPGTSSDAIIETIDIFPTLCELTSLPVAEFAHGSSLVSLIDGSEVESHDAIGYFRNARTIRTDTHRLIAHDDGFLELYDHSSNAGETKNVAKQNPDLAEQLLRRLNDRRLK